MRKIVILSMILFLFAPAVLAEETTNPATEWMSVVSPFHGCPFLLVQADSMNIILILDKDNPDPEKPVAIDVRNEDGVPVLFYVLQDEQYHLKWQHPAIKAQKIGL